MLSFLNQKGYCQGVVFFMLALVVSCINDVIVKFMGQRLDSMQVIFFRFFFSLVTILPFAFMKGMKVFKTSQLKTNITRGIFGAVSFYLFAYSIIHMQLVEVITILWTIPLFILVLSVLFLNESVGLMRWCATIIGFLGLAFITLYDADVSFSFKFIYVVPIAACLLFAIQDVMIKKMVDKESRVTMLSYFSLVTTALTIVPAMYVWETPTNFELSMLFLLGMFANVMQFFLFKAFQAADLSALSPYRYVEFVFSALAGFIFFSEVPGTNVLVGAIILIPSTLYLAYSENRKARKARA